MTLTKMLALKIAIEIVVILGTVILFVSFYVFFIYTRPPRWPEKTTPADFGLEYESITFKSTGGLELKGWFIPTAEKNQPTVIVCHGYPASKSNILSWGAFLHEKYNLFYFDFRAHGESAGKYTTFGYLEKNDLKGAVEYLKTRDDIAQNELGVMGFSMGGVVGLMTAPERDEVKAVVSDSAYASLDKMVEVVYGRYGFLKPPFVMMTKIFGRLLLGIDTAKISPQESVKGLNKPALIIHGQDDRVILPENADLIYNNIASSTKELWFVPQADHGETGFVQKTEYERRVFEFLDKYLN